MTLARLPSGLAGLALGVTLGVGCSNDGGETPGGGAPQAGAAGQPATGGANAAGTSASAGMAGSAGTPSSGGSSGASGGASSGGTSPSGGAESAGGTAGGGTAGTQAGSGPAGGASGGAGRAGSAGTGATAGMGAGGAAGASGSAGTAGAAGGAGGDGAATSAGCGKTPTLRNSPSATTFDYNTITSGGTERRYILRLPETYDSSHPYRLILGFHGATGNGGQVAGNPAFFGLYALANDSTIFVAPDAVDGLWSAAADTTLVDDILEQVEADLCIDLTRIELEGFSQGGAMVQTLACARPNVFRAAVAHSAGGLARPTSCEPIAYFGSLGLDENGGQSTQTDFFAMTSGCSVDTLPDPQTGSHLCSDYEGCSAGHPVRWCPYDGGHTPSPNDAGMNSSWMPEEVWDFLSQF